MTLFGVVFLMVALMLIGAGAVITVIGCVLAAALIGLGVFSSSVFVGVRSGRPSAGVQAFLLQCGIFAGIPAGAVCAGLAHSFFSAYGDGWPILVYGGLGGGFAGALVAIFLNTAVQVATTWASARLPRRGESPAEFLPK